MAEGDTTKLVGDSPGGARRSHSYTQPFELEMSSSHYTSGLHRVRNSEWNLLIKYSYLKY